MFRIKHVVIGSIIQVFALVAIAQVPPNADPQIFAKDPDNCVTVEKAGVWRSMPSKTKPPDDVIVISEDDILLEFRLINNCSRDIYYLSNFLYLDLYGFMIYRNRMGVWEARTPAWGRGFKGHEYRWRPLKPGESVCPQASDSSSIPGERSIALYYSYSPNPSQDSIIEVRAEPFSLGPAVQKLPLKRERPMSVPPNCVAEKGIGYLLGWIDRLVSAVYRPDISIVLESNGQQQTYTSDSKGEFNLKLPVGKYRLLRVFDKEGKILRTKKRRDGFRIRENRVTEWDMELRKPT
ncbi:MAG: hypothetical protein IPJ30_07030 [Acidobacteria bacterium]|nr:hypothetical protein [Acidobacteriota bacterium]MBK8147625.1 hypothetical protein [Acidobacteriota bacterium]